MKTFTVTLRRLQTVDVEVEAESVEDIGDEVWDNIDWDMDVENDIIAISCEGQALPVDLPTDLKYIELLEEALRVRNDTLTYIKDDCLHVCEEMDNMMDNGEWADAHELANDTLAHYAERIKLMLGSDKETAS